MNMKAIGYFKVRLLIEYESMINPKNFTVIDATMDIEEQQDIVRKHVLEILLSKKNVLDNIH